MRKRMLVVCAMAALSGSGCLTSRVMKSVVQAGDKNLTLVQTYDVYTALLFWPWAAKHQFWTCSETPGAIACTKACDGGGSDLTCPTIGAFSTDNSIQ